MIKWTNVLHKGIKICPDGYWSNGHIAIKGEPPAQLSKLKDFRRVEIPTPFSSLVPHGHYRVPALIIHEDRDRVTLRRCDSDLNVRIQTIYYEVFKACIDERYIFLIHDAKSIILCVNLKNEILGGVAPIGLNASS